VIVAPIASPKLAVAVPTLATTIGVPVVTVHE
jgi:hypothetical protein